MKMLDPDLCTSLGISDLMGVTLLTRDNLMFLVHVHMLEIQLVYVGIMWVFAHFVSYIRVYYCSY